MSNGLPAVDGPVRSPKRARRFGARAAQALATALVVLSGVLIPLGATPANAAGCGTAANPIVCENALPGTDPSAWEINGAGDSSIQGFSTDISTNVGGTVGFKIDSNARAYTIAIYRTGWYQGKGARKIADVTPSATLPQSQPQCITEAATEFYDCGNWALSASWPVPADAVSGVYFALLTRSDTGGSSHITFVVRNQASKSQVLFQTSDPTWQAYNTYGGSDFYQGAANGRAYKVSYNRPVATRGGVNGRDFYFSNEYPAVRFLEKNGYDVSYFSGVDTDRFGASLKNHKVFLSVGHDEYWSGAQRSNVEAARDAGVNLQFLSGNEVYWRTRYEPSADSSATAYRTLVSYKETWGNRKIDPSAQWTGTWRDPRFASAANGAGTPENGLTGTQYQSNFSDLAVTVSAAEGKTRLWRNTSLTGLAAGATAALAPHTIGYESDEDIDNGFRPAGLIRLSTTTGAVPEYLTDFGNTVVQGTTTHHVTLYRASSGALVFSAGSVQWTWGLDQEHDGAGAPADVRMQQAQVNLLADMGASPGTLAAGLVAASASTDGTAPTVSVTSPAAGTSVVNGSNTTISGTATDSGGGVVAGVEVSTDGGTSWQAATGTSNWSYSYVQHGVASTGIRIRAIDDSANYPATPTTLTLTVAGPYTVFGGQAPVTPDSQDASAVELGLRLTPTESGLISGVRFYKSAANTGTHTGSLWSSTGARLATATFTNETASGWQTATFATPVAVTAGTTYVASYWAPRGRYAADADAWAYRGITRAPLTVSGGFGAAPASVYNTNGDFPTDIFGQSNYYVDAVFTGSGSTAPVATAQSPGSGSSSVALNTAISATISTDVVASSVVFTVRTAQGTAVAGSTSYLAATRVATFTPSSALTAATSYSVTLTARDAAGATLSSGGTWSFSTVQPASNGDCPCSLYQDSTTPSVVTAADNQAVTLGVRFSAQSAGQITGVKFYKGPGNTGSHTGTLWATDGTELASGTFTAETASGWQTLVFAQPVSIQPATEYVAGYRTSVGQYSFTPGGYSAAYTRGPLSAGVNAGVFTYATGFPSSQTSTDYLVDVLYSTAGPAAVTVTSTTPSSGATGAATTATVTATLSAAPASGTPALALSTASGAVAGSSSYNAGTRVVTFTPASALAAGTAYSAVVSLGAAALAGGSWSFSTAASAGTGTEYSLLGTLSPAVVTDEDPSPVELGMSFSSSAAGSVTAIRFFKGAANTGTHTGSLWSSTGQRLATVTFTGETASGWQSAQLATPVALTAGQTYVVSYFAPVGRYSTTDNYFSTARTAGPLTAGSTSNGRYLYASAGGFPTDSWQSANYFVDVVFTTATTTTPPPAAVTVSTTSPASGATGVAVSTAVSATLSAAPAAGTPTLALSSSAGAVAGSSAYNATTRVLTFTPTAALTASTLYSAAVTLAGAAVSGGAWSFSTAAASTGTTVSLLTGVTPSVVSDSDTSRVELGMSFSSSAAGSVTAIRFFKGATNTGTHTGSLWSSTGQRLATVTFTNETASGWQSAQLATPVALTVGQTYVVSYFAPAGRYSKTANYFATARSVGPLTAGTTANGRYLYATAGGYPTSTWQAANYFVDVVFTPSG